MNINKKYKDRLFRFIFNDKKDLLTLYNAVNGSSYSNEEDLQINTINDIIYMGMKIERKTLSTIEFKSAEADMEYKTICLL